MRTNKISLFKDNIYENITKQENEIYKQPNITSKKLELNQNRTSISEIEIDDVDVNKTYLTFYSNDNLYFEINLSQVLLLRLRTMHLVKVNSVIVDSSTV